jgi:hypothetical protein
MPYTHTIYPEKNLAIVTGNGWIDLNMSLKAMDDLYKDPTFKSHYYVIVDLRRIEYLSSIDEGFDLNVFSSFQDALNFMSDCIGQCDHAEQNGQNENGVKPLLFNK